MLHRAPVLRDGGGSWDSFSNAAAVGDVEVVGAEGSEDPDFRPIELVGPFHAWEAKNDPPRQRAPYVRACSRSKGEQIGGGSGVDILLQALPSVMQFGLGSEFRGKSSEGLLRSMIMYKKRCGHYRITMRNHIDGAICRVLALGALEMFVFQCRTFFMLLAPPPPSLTTVMLVVRVNLSSQS